ncbi:hypothetical protein [Streptomyces sp. NPDC048111]|uniref:hypothetical protein n=1 Tax=Streptomyces sp. NPDC048111 TaxID=3365500 RepID=UPI00371780B8
MTLVVALILAVVLVPIAMLVFAPKAPARRNPFPRGRYARRRLPTVPRQSHARRHAR